MSGCGAYIKGPDFPTGGQVLNTPEELNQIYTTGSGAIRLRCTWEPGPTTRSAKTIHITSIPYMVNKAQLVERIADVIIARKLPPLLDVKDLSTDEVCIALELKRDADERMVMAYLFKHTQLQKNIFAVHLTCLVPTEQPEVGRPERLDLHDLLWHFLRFRLDVVTRRLDHELAALERRIHVLEGFEVVFDALDEVLRIVRLSEGKADAAVKIMKRFDLDAEQTDAILELKVYRLARLEILVIRKELAAKRRRAQEIGALLKDERERWALVRDEIRQIGEICGDSRRTLIESAGEEVEYSADDFIVDEDAIVLVTADGWVRRQKEVRDIAATRLREGDRLIAALAGSTRATCVFFSNFGIAYTARIIDIPATTGHGDPIQRLFKLKDGEHIVTARSLDPRVAARIAATREGDEPPQHAVTVSSDGYSLRFSLEPLLEPSTRNGRRFARPADGAEVVGVAPTTGGRDAHRRDGEGAGRALRRARRQLPLRSGPRRNPDQADPGRGPGARFHRLDRRPRSADRRNHPRRQPDRQHRQIRRHRPRGQGARVAAARSVHPRHPAAHRPAQSLTRRRLGPPWPGRRRLVGQPVSEPRDAGAGLHEPCYTGQRPVARPRVAPRTTMRPAGKARRGSKSGICDRGATPFRRDAASFECSGALATGR